MPEEEGDVALRYYDTYGIQIPVPSQLYFSTEMVASALGDMLESERLEIGERAKLLAASPADDDIIVGRIVAPLNGVAAVATVEFDRRFALELAHRLAPAYFQ